MIWLGLCGSVRSQLGHKWVKHGSYMGHMGHPGHVERVEWVTCILWVTGLVNQVKGLLGLLEFVDKNFWATALYNGCLGL